jgi:hypothetical protein
LLIVARARGNTSAAFACSSGAACEIRRRDKERAALDHQVERRVARERAVLDAVDARLDRGTDPVVAVCVGRNLEAGAMRLVGDRRQLLVGVLLRTRGAGMRHHTTRRADLDDLRAVLDLVSHRCAHLADPVGDALLDGQRHDVRREGLEHRRVEVTAGGCDGVAGGHDARPIDPAEIDRLLQGDVEQEAAGLNEQTEIPHGREPRSERATGVGDGAKGAHRGVVLYRVQRAGMVGTAEQQIDLHVHETREEREVADVEHDCVGGRRRRPDLDDAVCVDQQFAGLDDLARVDVEHAVAAQEDRRGGRAATGHERSFDFRLRRCRRGGRQGAQALDEVLERRARRVHRRGAGGFEPVDIAPRDRAADDEQHVIGPRRAQCVGGLLRQGDVCTAQNAQADDLDVLLNRDGGDRLGPLPDPEVDHLEARVAQRAGDELRAAVVPVEAGLGDEHAHRHQKTAGCWNSPH